MNKILITALLLICPSIAFATTPPAISVGSVSGFPGQIIAVPITADLSSPISGFQFDVQYDPALLTYSGIANGTAIANWSALANPSVSGHLLTGAYGVTLINGNSQQILVLNFMVNSTPGKASLASPNLIISKALVNETSVTSINNGNFTLNLLGDANGDGKVTVEDAVLVAQSVVGSATLSASQLKSSDVSLDGSVTMYDAALIAEYASGIISKFN